MNPKWALKRKTGAEIGPKKPRGPRWKPEPDGKDPEHLAWLRTLACAVITFPIEDAGGRHWGSTEAHHHTHGRGMSQKVPDRKAFPLCNLCHHDFHAAVNRFRGWTKERRRAWQDRMVLRYRDGAEGLARWIRQQSSPVPGAQRR